ncbi:aldo/keto reductase [Dongia deserti]|uniref:aldo/keto reductase n=1 Tax=Dongia deserti TaxID=2268030 RepID=UPI000E65CD70|nr:aldo/keto reductase [Dongia deserti]
MRNLGKTPLRVTEIGFGGAPLGNLFAVVTDTEAQASLATAWENGCRFFDTAPLYGYGLSERRVGDALREKPRDRYVLSSKVGRLLRPGTLGRGDGTDFKSPMPFYAEFDYSYDATMRSIEDSLQRLGLDRIDVALIHDVGRDWHGDQQPAMFRQAMSGAAKALAELRAAGRIGAIGLGVNESDVCEEALEHGDFDCFLLAGRYTLLEQAPLDRLFPACQKRNVSIIIGGPFNSGLLARVGQPDATYNYGAVPPEIAQRAAALHEVCGRHGVPLPAAALQFPLAHPVVASVIPGARNTAEVASHWQWARLRLPAALWEDLRERGLLHPEAPVPQGPVL